MTPPADPSIDHLRQLVSEFRAAEEIATKKRALVDAYIQELKRQGYSYPLLSRESGFAVATVQLIISKGGK